jgi:hypothetical protein
MKSGGEGVSCARGGVENFRSLMNENVDEMARETREMFARCFLSFTNFSSKCFQSFTVFSHLHTVSSIFSLKLLICDANDP